MTAVSLGRGAAGGRVRGKELKAVRIGGGVDVVAEIIALFDEVIDRVGASDIAIPSPNDSYSEWSV